MDFIQAINEKLQDLDLSLDIKAFPLLDLQDHVVLVDTHDTTVYSSHEGCYRLLALLGDDCEDPVEAVFHALRSNLTEIKAYQETSGGYRHERRAMEWAAEEDPL